MVKNAYLYEYFIMPKLASWQQDFALGKSIKKGIIESTILNELKKQQNNKFYNFKQYHISSKLNTVFIANLKIYKQNLPPKPANFRQLKGYAFKKQFQKNMKSHIREYKMQCWS